MSAREQLLARLVLAQYAAAADPKTKHLAYLVRGFRADVYGGRPIAFVTDCTVPEGI